MTETWAILTAFFWILLVLVFYLGPAIIAFARSHHNAGAILALNVLLGWSVLGWIGAFVWSLTRVESSY